jgi:hypothetical protein
MRIGKDRPGLFSLSSKSARTLALCGDHSNYTFEQAGYNTAGRDSKTVYRSIQISATRDTGDALT